MSTAASERTDRLQDRVIHETRAAAKEVFRYAKAVPADKLEWKPLEAGRSVIDLCREMAMCPGWAVDIIEGKPQDWSEESIAAMQAEQAQWTTAEACEAECYRRLDGFEQLLKDLPDSRLSETRWLPYDGGRDFTMPEMMDYPRWNFNYHLGQIAYIQTLYGDKEMH